MAVLVGSGTLGPSAEAQRAKVPSIKKTVEGAVGASITHRADLKVEREKYTIDGTYGFTLWEPEEKETSEHGGTPVVRVAQAYDLKPGQIKSTVQARLDELSDVPAKRQNVKVGKKKYKGVAVGPIPGSTPSTEVYVAVEDRVYQINVYGAKLDAEGKELLRSLEFGTPAKSGLSSPPPDAGDPRTLYKTDKETVELTKREEDARRKESSPTETTRSASSLTTSQVPTYAERKISGGCWLAASKFFVQTQHGYRANRFADDPGTNAPTGFAPVGVPNYWGQYTHGNLGYGRCVSTQYTNDMYAVDYPLNGGDVVFSPFKSGTVMFAGRNNSHKNYGIFVVIRASNGKYVSMSAHLSSLASGIRRGVKVTDATVIGYAGATGDPSIPVGEVHLHQAFYRYPRVLTDGSPYGGQGLKVVYHNYTGLGRNANPGVYQFVPPGADTVKTTTKREFVGN